MSFESLPSTVRNELVDACDDFERAWRGGRRPRIEEYLGTRTDPERTEAHMLPGSNRDAEDADEQPGSANISNGSDGHRGDPHPL
ncbi:MAG: hypothetical protein WKF75_02755 [Singulisphaera sp.]